MGLFLLFFGLDIFSVICGLNEMSTIDMIKSIYAQGTSHSYQMD